MVERGKYGKGQVDVPNGNIVVRRTRATGNWRYRITDCFIAKSVQIKYINCPYNDEKAEEDKKQPVMGNERL